MRVLGINYNEDRSSAVSVHNTTVMGGLFTSTTAFPSDLLADLRDPHHDWDYAVCTSNRDYNEFKRMLKPLTAARPAQVDYCEALGMSAICMRDWGSCAVMIIDSYHCCLGYYSDGSFHWLKQFYYPNSLALFYSAAARFLGFDPLTQEYQLTEASLYGKPIYSDLIEQKFIRVSSDGYSLTQNLERGIGRSVLNVDMAASVQGIFSKTVLALANWLSARTDSKRLAYVGRASANYLTNSSLALNSNFNEISIQPLTSAAGAALGAAALLSRPIHDKIDIGLDRNSTYSCELMVSELLQGKIIPYSTGRSEFIDRSVINNNWLAIPFEPIIETFRQKAGLVNYWQQPFTVCQEKLYNNYFIGDVNTAYGQYSSYNIATERYNRVVTTTMNRHSFINRVLELLKSSGYNTLISSPIENNNAI